MKHIAALLKESREVLLGCIMENGAIVAANTSHLSYPKNVSNYNYVWPRDVAFTLYAGRLLKIPNVQNRFLAWLLERAEGFSDTGLIYQRYAANGARDTEFGSQSQPDQAGALIWSLLQYKKSANSKKAIALLANGLCSIWKVSKFTISVHDLWEERNVDDSDNVFSYTLAACSTGLSLAAKAFNNEKWAAVASQMRSSLSQCKESFFPRVCNHPDGHVDGSLLALIWPFPLDDLRAVSSLKEIESRLLSSVGVRRYEGDVYDGILKHTKLKNSGGGGWPLLTYWYCIALSRLGRKGEARKLFESYSSNFRSYIPEQLHLSKKPSVSPLCWSHSMFVIAAKELGYF